MNFLIFAEIFASLAQLVEQLIRNEQVVGSSPIGGSWIGVPIAIGSGFPIADL